MNNISHICYILFAIKTFSTKLQHILQKNIYLEYNINRINPTAKVPFLLYDIFLLQFMKFWTLT